MTNTYNQLIIGSDFAGLCAAIKLKARGTTLQFLNATICWVELGMLTITPVQLMI